jgi:WD40 repeat protein
MTGDLLGTPNYMAPEQVNGRNSLVGPSADVYALGAMLYAMLVGQPPFQSDSVSDTLYRIGNAEPTRLRQIRRGVPRDLETICLKCLEKLPVSRYSSAAELADDLQRYLSGEPLRARPISRVERGRRWFVRNPVVGTLAIGIAVALIAGTGFSLHYARQAGLREQQALANLYAADMNLAQQHVRSGAVASALRLLERHRSQTGDMDDQGWEWRHLWHQCHGELRRFEGPQGAIYALAVSSDGRTLASAGIDQIIWVWDVATGNVRYRLEGHTATVRDMAFIDNQRLATVGDDGVGLIWNTATGERLATLVATDHAPGGACSRVDDTQTLATDKSPAVTNGNGRPLSTLAISADQRFLATGSNNDVGVNLWDAGSLTMLLSLDLGPVECLAFAPDNLRLALAGGDGYIRVCRRDDDGSWPIVATYRAHAEAVRDLAWSPDGTHLASAGADHVVSVWDCSSREKLASIATFKDAVYSIRFRSDGKRLAMAARNEPVKVWDFDEQRVVAELRGHTALVTAIELCPAGWRLFSSSEDGTLRLWDVAQAGDHQQLEGHLGHVRSVAFSPREDILASGGADDQAIILWNSATGQPHRLIRPPRSSVVDVAFSPDGRYLASALGYGEEVGHLFIWDVEHGRATLDLELAPGPLSDLDWSPTGSQIAAHSSSSGTSWLIDARSGRQIATCSSPQGPNGSISFDGDGRLLVIGGGDDTVRVRRSNTLSPIAELRGHTAPVVKAVFNPQGTIIASSSNDHTIRLWDAATGRCLRSLTGHGGTPFGLAFSPDGKRLASSSTDQTVKLWDVATGLELQSLAGHTDWVRDVTFSTDGQLLATAAYDGTVRVWQAQSSAADAGVTREAAALVDSLATRLDARDSLIAAIESDETISDAVRTAATSQAKALQFHWRSMLAGHRAAQRGDWTAAVDAFERLTTLAPDDGIHWFWLAMASLAGDRRDSYQLACEEMLRRHRREASDIEIFLVLRTWLASDAHDADELASLAPLVETYEKQSARPHMIPWLYRLRTRKNMEVRSDSSNPPPSFGPPPEGWYILAMSWLELGDRTNALAAYEAGVRECRRATTRWDAEIYRKRLQREVEQLLEEESVTNQAPASATSDQASSSGSRADESSL